MKPRFLIIIAFALVPLIVAGCNILAPASYIIEGTGTALSPILENPGPVHSYKPGTMGPDLAEKMTTHYGGWIQPLGAASDRPA